MHDLAHRHRPASGRRCAARGPPAPPPRSDRGSCRPWPRLSGPRGGQHLAPAAGRQGLAPGRGLQRVAQGVAEQDQRQDRQGDHQRRAHDGPRVVVDAVEGVLHHQTPRRSRRVAEPQEGDAGLDADARGQDERALDDHRGADRPEHVPTDDPQVRETDDPGGVDVQLVARTQRHRSDHPVEDRGDDDAEDRHRDRDVGPGQRVERDEQHDGRQRHDRVGEETGDAFDPSAVEARREAAEHADRGGDREDDEGGDSGLARTPDEPGQDVAARGVATQRVAGGERRGVGRLQLGERRARTGPARGRRWRRR